MKIVGFKYSHTIYIVMIDEGIHTNTTHLKRHADPTPPELRGGGSIVL